MRSRTRLAALALVGALMVQSFWAAPAQAHQPRTYDAGTEFATGFASFIISPVYGGFKVATAFLGLFVGGATWIFTGADTETAMKVWNPTMRGTYVISPQHLRGEMPIQFIGPR